MKRECCTRCHSLSRASFYSLLPAQIFIILTICLKVIRILQQNQRAGCLTLVEDGWASLKSLLNPDPVSDTFFKTYFVQILKQKLSYKDSYHCYETWCVPVWNRYFWPSPKKKFGSGSMLLPIRNEFIIPVLLLYSLDVDHLWSRSGKNNKLLTVKMGLGTKVHNRMIKS
jgi:hypothetical protein